MVEYPIVPYSKPYVVYAHRNKINGKIYIGITCQKLNVRWGHNGRAYIRDHQPFGNAIEKYGWDNFEHIIIKHGITKQEACIYEIELIAALKTQDRKYGYNISSGGDIISLGCRRTEEQKDKVRGGNNIMATPVIRINDGKTFQTIKEAAKSVGLSPSSVRDCCLGYARYSGFEKNSKTPINWMFLEEWNELYETEKQLIKSHLVLAPGAKPIIYLERLIVFNSKRSVLKFLGRVGNSGLDKCLNGMVNNYKTDPETGEPMTWMYYTDFLEMLNENGMSALDFRIIYHDGPFLMDSSYKKGVVPHKYTDKGCEL